MNRLVALGLTLVASTGAAEERLVRLPDYFTVETRDDATALNPSLGELAVAPNLATELRTIPGVFGQTRAADALEPNIRGLGFDRVSTTLNGLPLWNASPDRTQSPVATLGPGTVRTVEIARTLPSVTQGPVTTGGHVRLTSYNDDALAQDAMTVAYDAVRGGTVTQGRVGMAKRGLIAEVAAFRSRLGDYTAADGRRVAARFEDHGGSLGLGWQAGQQSGHLAVINRRLLRQDSVSLPLDGKNSSSSIVTVDESWRCDHSALEQVDCRVGWTTADPYTTSEDRATPAPTFAQATVRSSAAAVSSRWRVPHRISLTLGADWSRQNRRAIRTTPAGRDYIWPDTVYDDLGAFVETRQSWPPFWSLRLGVRGDRVWSDARDADRLALGRPIREQFIAFNGPTASAVARDDLVGAANMQLQWRRAAGREIFFGAGVSAQAAPATERYRALLNALGGDGHGGNAVELGNPALDAERNRVVELGGRWKNPHLTGEARFYCYKIDGFILRTPVGVTPPPLSRMVVFGYRNVDAMFYGGELSLAWKPTARWTVPLTIARSEGKRRDGPTGLADLPPWEGTAEVRYSRNESPCPFSLAVGARIVGAKTNPAPQDNPLFVSTGGFALWHAHAALELSPRFSLSVAVTNLLDRRYTEYLTPPVAAIAPVSGDLRPGDRVPGPGRSMVTSLSFHW